MPGDFTIVYNDVELEIKRLIGFEGRDVYDPSGVNYLYTHYVIEAICVFNPFATAANRIDGSRQYGNLTIPIHQGDPMPQSINELSRKLLQERKFLAVGVHNTAILFSPQFFAAGGLILPFTTDANNGPHPIDFKVLEWHGTKTALCYFKIETWLNQCDNARAILSHRWEMEHQIDQQFLTTRVIKGRCIFRTDVLQQTTLKPDDFRHRLIHRLPDTFRRQRVHVRAAEDGTRLDYTVIDQEKISTINRVWGITECEATFHRAIDWIQPFNPSAEESIVVRVWGKRTTPRNMLVGAVFHAMPTWIGTGFGSGVILPATAGDLTVDCMGKYAQGTMRFSASGVGHLAGALAQGIVVLPALVIPPHFPNRTDWPENLGTDAFGLPAVAAVDPSLHGDIQNPSPPASDGTRGHYLARCVAQALTANCQIVPNPTEPAVAKLATVSPG